MTAHELARQLLNGPDMDVMFAYPSGDYWRTEVAEAVESVRTKEVTYSEYHQKHEVADDEDSDNDADVYRVVLIS